MGMLADIGMGLASGVGSAVEKVGLAKVHEDIQAARDARLDEMAGAREAAGDTRRAGIAKDAEDRGILNRAKERADIVAETIANAPKLREISIEDWNAKAKAEQAFKTDPKNVEAQATAKALGDKIIATSAASTTAEMLKDPAYLENMRKVTMAQHPEKAAQIAAAMASMASSKFELDQKKGIADARKDLTAAKTPEEKKAAEAKIEALTWTLEGQRARDAGDAAVLKSFEQNIKDNRAAAAVLGADPATVAARNADADASQRAYTAYQKTILERKGIAPSAAAPAGKVQRDTEGNVFVDGVKIPGKATTNDAAAALARAHLAGANKPAADTSARPGLINAPSPSFVPGQLPTTGRALPAEYNRALEMRPR